MEKGNLSTILADLNLIYGQLRSRYYLAIIGIIVIWLMSGIYIVQSNEQGIVRRFGKIARSSVSPGMHYRLPWPIEQVDQPKVKDIKRIRTGFTTRRSKADATVVQRLTGDMNIINLSLLLQYTIRDAVDYILRTEDVNLLVQNVAESALTQVVSEMSVDEILTVGKLKIQRRIQSIMQESLNRYNSGVEILNCNLENIIPPKEVMESFKDIINAQADKDKRISDAEAYKNLVIPAARGSAESSLRAAEAYRQNVINRALGDSKRFLEIWKEYRKSPQISRDRLYIETMEKIGPKMTKLIISSCLDSNIIKIYGAGTPEASKGSDIGLELAAIEPSSNQTTIRDDIAFPQKGSNRVEKISYDPNNGRIYINNKQYFEGILPKVWNYQTGEFKFVEQYLENRKNRRLSSRDIDNFIMLTEKIALRLR